MKNAQLDLEDLIVVARLSIFSGFFNKKPHTNLYYSELLLTKTQKDDYEEAINKILELLTKKRENY